MTAERRTGTPIRDRVPGLLALASLVGLVALSALAVCAERYRAPDQP